MSLDPGPCGGLVRAYATERPRDVAEGRVPIQWLHPDGSVGRETDADARLVEALARVARREGFTLDQMLSAALEELRAMIDGKELWG